MFPHFLTQTQTISHYNFTAFLDFACSLFDGQQGGDCSGLEKKLAVYVYEKIPYCSR